MFPEGCLGWCRVWHPTQQLPTQQLYHLSQQGASGETLCPHERVLQITGAESTLSRECDDKDWLKSQLQPEMLH